MDPKLVSIFWYSATTSVALVFIGYKFAPAIFEFFEKIVKSWNQKNKRFGDSYEELIRQKSREISKTGKQQPTQSSAPSPSRAQNKQNKKQKPSRPKELSFNMLGRLSQKGDHKQFYQQILNGQIPDDSHFLYLNKLNICSPSKVISICENLSQYLSVQSMDSHLDPHHFCAAIEIFYTLELVTHELLHEEESSTLQKLTSKNPYYTESFYFKFLSSTGLTESVLLKKVFQGGLRELFLKSAYRPNKIFWNSILFDQGQFSYSEAQAFYQELSALGQYLKTMADISLEGQQDLTWAKKVLGVEDLELKHIKKRYRSTVKSSHPDSIAGFASFLKRPHEFEKVANEHFSSVQKAYEILKKAA